MPLAGRLPACSSSVSQSSCVIFVSRGAKQAADQSKNPCSAACIPGVVFMKLPDLGGGMRA